MSEILKENKDNGTRDKISLSIKFKTKPPSIQNPASVNTFSQPPPSKKLKLNFTETPDFYSDAHRIYNILITNQSMGVLSSNNSMTENTESAIISFESIKTKLSSKSYKSLVEFTNELSLMFETFKKSNSPDNIIFKAAEQLQNILQNELTVIETEKSQFQEHDIKTLFSHIQNQETVLAEKIIKKFPKIVHQLQPHRLPETTPYTWSALHFACYHGDERLVRAIIEAGADIEIQDTLYKARPLGWAAYGGHSELCQLLVNTFNADPWARNMHGQTAYALITDPAHPRWSGIWSNRRVENETIARPDQQESFKVKIVASESKKSTSKVLLKVPTLGKKEDDEEEDDEEADDSYISKPYKRQNPIQQVSVQRTPTSQASAPNPFALSYGIPKLEKFTFVKSVGVVSNDESIKSMLDVDPDFFGTCLSVHSSVQSLNMRLFLNIPEEHTAYATGIIYSHKTEVLKCKMSKTGQIQDTQVWLRDGVNIFEFRVIGGIVDESEVGRARNYLEFNPGTEKGQTFLLVVYRC